VLCLQDTTELDYNGQAMSGLGPLSYEAQRSLYLHPIHVVSPEREPLGVTNAWTWARSSRRATHRGAGSWRACAGLRATSASPSRRGPCPAPVTCAWGTGSPTSWPCCSRPASWSTSPTTWCAVSTTGCCPKATSCGSGCWAVRPWAGCASRSPPGGGARRGWSSRNCGLNG
jgi:hypothetical protein